MTCPYCSNDDGSLLERVRGGWLCHVCAKLFPVLAATCAGFLLAHGSNHLID